MDKYDSFASSEGTAAIGNEEVGKAAAGIGQLFKGSKNDALACGAEPQGKLEIQGKDMPWAQAVKGMGVWADRALSMEKHMAEMRTKATASLTTIVMC